MAKGTRKRVQSDKDRSGCMWGFINIFDFRHGRPSHKLIQDRKRGSRRIAGAASPVDELNRRGELCEACKDVIAGEQHGAETVDKLSVKSLMEEEMFEPGKPGHGKTKTRHFKKKSFDLTDVHFVASRQTHKKHKSLGSLDFTGIMSELCSQVHVKDDNTQDVSVSSVTEERLREATRVFVRHFVEGRNTEETKMLNSGDLMEAVRILNSNKEMFLRLLRDPDSELAKLLDDQSENEQVKCKTNQICFWRRLKTIDRKDSSRIIVLKPEDVRGEDQGERGSSRFLFTEFTRKLKMVMKKEHENVGEESQSSIDMDKIPKDSFSSIYTEAKRHLAEIVRNGDVEGGIGSGQDPESLGRILSYSDYNGRSPICSPRKDDVLEGNASDLGSAKNECEEADDDLEVPKREIIAICDEDEFETENRESEESDEGNEPAEGKPKDSEAGQGLDLNMDELMMNQPSSPVASSSSVSSRADDSEDPESVTDKSERPSPVSVLEPAFIEDEVSPPSTKSYSVSELIQPRQIKFEDHMCRNPRSRSWDDEKKSVLDFVESLVRASGLTYRQLLERFLFSERILDQSVFNQVCFNLDELVYDPNLLFDLVVDVLIEVCRRDFDGIPSIRETKLTRKTLVDEARRGVDWHLQSEHTERTLDQTVAKDFSKLWTWMDLRLDSERVGVEVQEEIFDELVEDAITSFVCS